MLVIPPNTPSAVRILAADGNSALFPRINIYDSTNALVSTLSPTHISEGVYSADWTPTIEGAYSAVGTFFADALFTIDAGYEKSLEDIDVSSVKSDIARILGLVHENVVIDQQIYDSNGCLTSARVRAYDSKTNAQAAGVTGLLATYTQTISYSGGLPNKYQMVRDG